jgi:hypothetical protein
MMLFFRDFLSHELIVVFVFVFIYLIVMKVCLFSVGAMVDCCTFLIKLVIVLIVAFD